jgi:hypothetical protein
MKTIRGEADVIKTYTRKSTYTEDTALGVYVRNDKASIDEIPKTISLPNAEIKIQDDSGFVFLLAAANNPGKEWIKEGEWYRHVQSGLKAKLHAPKSRTYQEAVMELQVMFP